jgi:glucokinase
MDWHGVALGELILKHTGLPALIMNRHRTSGLAEARFGIGRNTGNLIYIGVGTGISAALISNGVLLEGTSFSAGEIGHVVIDPKGPLCGCGRHGCLQAMASSRALVRIVRELYASLASRNSTPPANPLWEILHDNSMISGELIGIEANNGNPAAIDCIQKIAEYLGLAAGNLINIMNPRKIIIGGSLGNTGPLLTKLIAREAAKHAMPTPMAAVTIEQGLLGNRASALGATCLPLQYKLEILTEQISPGSGD